MAKPQRHGCGGLKARQLNKLAWPTTCAPMDTDSIVRIHIDDIAIPDEVSLHAKIVIQQWLAHAHVAAEKGDLFEAMRLVGLVRAKISDQMAKTRLGCVEG